MESNPIVGLLVLTVILVIFTVAAGIVLWIACVVREYLDYREMKAIAEEIRAIEQGPIKASRVRYGVVTRK